MFLDRLMNQTNAPLLERVLDFTSKRARLLATDIANVDTPDYKQQDLSTEKFEQMLSRRVEERDSSPPGSVGFDDIDQEISHPSGLLNHDGNNRSMEHLMSDEAKNAILHNLIVELLRQQFQQLQSALKEKVS
jgi:flagellar basal-body rod protein FlgB